MNYQKIILIGHATGDAEVHRPQGKTAYADFTLAVNRNQDQTDFFPVRVFDKPSQRAANIKKGNQVFVEGRVAIERYQPEGETKPRTVIRVVGNLVWIL